MVKPMQFVNERQTIVYPTRIVQTQGDVTNEQNLFVEKPMALVSTFIEDRNTRLARQGETPAWILLDFGKELQGGIRMAISRTAPDCLKLRLVFGESVTEALSDVGQSGATNHHSPRDIIVDVSNLSVLEFGRTGFRFCKVELAEPGTVWFKNIVAVSKTADLDSRGYIRTSDDRFNEILDTALYTAYLNMQDGVIWDGIKRDRLVWSGDLNSEILTLGYTYGPVPHIRNSLELLRNETPDNVWMNNIPSYSMWWVLNLVDYYCLSGDREYFEANLDYVGYVLNDLDRCITDRDVDLTRSGKETVRPYFLDWPTANTKDAFCGTMMLFLYTLKKLQTISCAKIDHRLISSLIGRLEQYTAIGVDMKETLAMQVSCGSQKPDARALLEQDGAKGFSTFMMYFVLKALDISGSHRTLALAKEYYGAMLDRGATSFWEDFDMEWLAGSGRIDELNVPGVKDLHADYGKYCYTGLRHSLCHGWSCGVVSYAVENILGLQLLAPGFARVRVSPKLFDLEWAEGSIPTPYGNIQIFAQVGKEPQITLPHGIQLVP